MNIYLVATKEGGLKELPRVMYTKYQLVTAPDMEKACAIYNAENRCHYFYGEVIAKVKNIEKMKEQLQKIESDEKVLLDLSFEKVIVRATT